MTRCLQFHGLFWTLFITLAMGRPIVAQEIEIPYFKAKVGDWSRFMGSAKKRNGNSVLYQVTRKVTAVEADKVWISQETLYIQGGKEHGAKETSKLDYPRTKRSPSIQLAGLKKQPHGQVQTTDEGAETVDVGKRKFRSEGRRHKFYLENGRYGKYETWQHADVPLEGTVKVILTFGTAKNVVGARAEEWETTVMEDLIAFGHADDAGSESKPDTGKGNAVK